MGWQTKGTEARAAMAGPQTEGDGGGGGGENGGGGGGGGA